MDCYIVTGDTLTTVREAKTFKVFSRPVACRATLQDCADFLDGVSLGRWFRYVKGQEAQGVGAALLQHTLARVSGVEKPGVR